MAARARAVLRSCGPLLVLTAAVLVLQPLPAESAALISPGNGLNTKPMRNVCLVYYQAIVDCDPAKDPSTYTGYEVELFKRVADWMATTYAYTEWAPTNYTFTCMNWEAMMADLLQPASNRTCDVGVAGISATSDRLEQGYRFTSPTYESGRDIMIYVPPSTDMFLFLKPFDATVWLVIIATSVFVGIAVTFAEVPFVRIVQQPAPSFQKYLNLQWASTAMLLQAMQQFSAKSVGARVIILGYAFMVLILINAYIAVLSSQLTVNSINLNIKGLNDLTSKPVGIFEADVVAFKRFNLQYTVPLPWNNAEDEATMLSMLRTGQITALVLDKPFVEYQAAVSCDLYVVGDTVLANNLGFAFPPDTSMDYVTVFSQGLTFLEESGVMADLKAIYITPSGACPTKHSANLANAQITMPQIAGLWVFLAASCVAGYGYNLVLAFVTWFRKRCMTSVDEDDEDSSKGASGSMSMTRNQVAPSASSGSFRQRLNSLARNSPEMAWVSVADASTTEEGLELLEAHMRILEKRIKTLGGNVEARLLQIMGAIESLNPNAGVMEEGMEMLPTLSKASKGKAKDDYSNHGRAVSFGTLPLALPVPPSEPPPVPSPAAAGLLSPRAKQQQMGDMAATVTIRAPTAGGAASKSSGGAAGDGQVEQTMVESMVAGTATVTLTNGGSGARAGGAVSPVGGDSIITL